MTWQERARRWFVEYNPLYFASATSVLAGVWLVAEGLPVDHFGSKAAVVAVSEAYQLLVIAGAWLLLRAGQRRPAALLGLVALLFTLDVALNGERLFSHARTLSLAPGMRARYVVPASLLFAAFGPLKLALLARVFRLPGTGRFLAVAGAAVFALPLLPYAIEAAGGDDARRLAHLRVFWLGAPLLGWALARPAWRAAADEDLRARRIAVAVPLLVAGLFISHAAMWSSFPALRLTPAHASPYLLVMFALGADRLSGRRAELAAWAGALLAMGTSTPQVQPLGLMAILSGGAMLALAERRGLRLLLPSIVCVCGGAFLLSGGGVPDLPWTLSLAAALTLAAVGRRDLPCLLGAGGAIAASIGLTPPLLPHAAMAGALWVAATSWLLFPERRRWLPCAALAVVLAAGVEPILREPALNALGYLGTSLLALALGLGGRWLEYKLVGVAGLSTFAVITHSMYAPRSALSWGLLLLGFGFAFLAAGVLVNLRAGSRNRESGSVPLPPSP